MMNDIYNYLQLSDTLFCGGMPTADQLVSVAQAGVKLVINLATAKSENALPNEAELIKELGMEYVHIPVDWNQPTEENLTEFMNAMDSRKNVKTFVHCQANYRATAFIALYRVLRLGWQDKNAFDNLRKMWDTQKYPVWKKFIEDMLKKRS